MLQAGDACQVAEAADSKEISVTGLDAFGHGFRRRTGLAARIGGRRARRGRPVATEADRGLRAHSARPWPGDDEAGATGAGDRPNAAGAGDGRKRALQRFVDRAADRAGTGRLTGRDQFPRAVRYSTTMSPSMFR